MVADMVANRADTVVDSVVDNAADRPATPAVVTDTCLVTAPKDKSAITAARYAFSSILMSHYANILQVGHLSRDCPSETSAERTCYKVSCPCSSWCRVTVDVHSVQATRTRSGPVPKLSPRSGANENPTVHDDTMRTILRTREDDDKLLIPRAILERVVSRQLRI